MNRIILAACLLIMTIPLSAWPLDGPLEVRNEFPLFVGIDPPYLESAAVQDRVSLDLSHSSTYMMQEYGAWKVNMDLEMTEVNLRLKKRIGSATEIGLDQPFLRMAQGFLDRPVAGIHKTLKTGDYGRSERPTNEFLYQVTFQGTPVVIPGNGASGPGDTRLTVKHALTGGMPIVSCLAGVELPTGDAKRGFGNGSVDASLALLVDLELGKKYHGYGNVGAVFPGDLKGYQTLSLRNYAYGGVGLEAAWWDHTHAIFQVLVQGSPFPDTGIRQVDWPGVMLVIGGRYSFEKSGIEFSLTEDPDTAATPDFILTVGYSMQL